MQFCHGWLLRKMWLKCCFLPLDLARWPSLGHFLPFPAISGHVHGPRCSRLCFNRPFYIGNECCFINFCPKIDIWGWRSSRWPSLGRCRPPRGPRWSSPKCKLIRIWFRSHLPDINFALKCIPEAVLDGLLLLGVALKATLGFHPILVFWGPLTSPNTWKVVSLIIVEFLPFSATTYGLTVCLGYQWHFL